MKTLLGLLLSVAFAGGVAAESIFTLVPPSGVVSPGEAVTIEWVAINPGATEVAFETPRVMEARLRSGGKTWPVTLRPEETAQATVAPSGFSHRAYSMNLPAEALGLVVLEVEQPDQPPLRAVLDVRSEPDLPSRPRQSRISSLAEPAPAASAIVRTFAGRLGAHEPIYFIYGEDDPAAKFQFSFKYRLLTFMNGRNGIWPDSLQFAFTQRSVWDIRGESSPFYDTSYMPEIMLEALAPAREPDDGWLSFLGYQAGFRHESNGRDGDISRSLGQVYLRAVAAIGPLDGWHLLIAPEVVTYATDLSNNPRLKDYRGYGQLRMMFGRNDGPSLMMTTWAGKEFDHASVQLDLTIPIKTRLLDFQTYLLIQYFDGYGESLLSYDQPSEALRAGLSFVR